MKARYETTLWQNLVEKGLVVGDEPAEVEDSAPWYIRTMLGIAGWIGALFILAAVFGSFAILFDTDSAMVAAVLGTVSCLVSVIIYRSARNRRLRDPSRGARAAPSTAASSEPREESGIPPRPPRPCWRRPARCSARARYRARHRSRLRPLAAEPGPTRWLL